MNDVERALLDIAEVRERLGAVQRFKGYSGVAAVLSGVFALVAGTVQALIAPSVQTPRDGHIYFAIWLICCAAAAIVNYGAIAHWFISDASVRDRWQTRTVGLAMLPAIILGAALSFAMLQNGSFALLPAVWYGCYGVGLFASRTMIPPKTVPISAGFLLIGIALLYVPPAIALQWWVLAGGFGIGQIAIGIIILQERARASRGGESAS